MSNLRSGLALSVLCAAFSVAAADTIVYVQNFEGALGGEWTGVTTTTGVQGFSTLPAASGLGTFGGSMLHNATGGDFGNGTFVGDPGSTSILTLTGLPSHARLRINFLLAVVDSWDGTGGTPSPDFFEIKVDGSVVFQHSFANAPGTGTGSYPNLSMSGLPSSPGGHPQLGFNLGNVWHFDDGYDLTFARELQSIAHTSSTVVIEFRAFGDGWQGGVDESWGMDSLEIGVCPCPCDFDPDPACNIFDFLEFQNQFVGGEQCACNLDPDPACNIFDFLEFQNQFVAGCP